MRLLNLKASGQVAKPFTRVANYFHFPVETRSVGEALPIKAISVQNSSLGQVNSQIAKVSRVEYLTFRGNSRNLLLRNRADMLWLRNCNNRKQRPGVHLLPSEKSTGSLFE